MKFLLTTHLLCTFFIITSLPAQNYIVRDIKTFGAKGNGKTNDQEAFKKAAAFFNNRGGNGKLTISAGIYIVGKQTFMGGQVNMPAFAGDDVLHFENLKNFTVEGLPHSILKYKDSLRFGAFSPVTGKPYLHGNNLFTTGSYAAVAGNCIFLSNCTDVTIQNVTMDGNNKGHILGGVFGDVGRQVSHTGIFIKNSKNIVVNKVNVHHFGLDGISVSNVVKQQNDSISILKSSFEYNGRQGLSWVGGNGLIARNCKFNHTGKGAFSSPPSAGVDIEAEVGPIRNGVFTDCEFVNNTGLGVGADTGDSGDCTFTSCTFWGTTNWSLWVTKPGFTFIQCNIYGSTAHLFDSPDDRSATKFTGCNFEDKLYEGKEPYGNYLIESNGAKRTSFSNCSFIANSKKLCWITSISSQTEEKYQFTNCSFVVKNAAYKKGDFVAIIRGMALKNCTFEFKNPEAKRNGLWLGGYNEKSNVDLGGNKIIYSGN